MRTTITITEAQTEGMTCWPDYMPGKEEPCSNPPCWNSLAPAEGLIVHTRQGTFIFCEECRKEHINHETFITDGNNT